MLRPSLSEGVCSLQPGVTRLTVTVDTPFNEQGRPETASFYPSCIRSRARLTYDDVHAYLTRQEERRKGRTIPVEIGEMLRRMETFAGRLTLARADRGAVDFDPAEGKLRKQARVTERRDISSRLQAWSAAARGGKYERFVNMLLLRSLMLARYGPESMGPFR